MSAHFGVASQHASRVAHNPYRKNIYRELFPSPKLSFKTRVISKAVNIKNRIVVIFTAWKKPTASRTIRRVVKTSSIGARNKDDPHLVERV